MSTSLSPRAAYAGGFIIGAGVLMAVLIQIGLISPGSTLLLIIANSMAAVGGGIVFGDNLRDKKIQYVAVVIGVLIGLFLFVCIVWATQGNRLAEDSGLAVSMVAFFSCSAGLDDILNRITRWWHVLLVAAGGGNIVVMILLVMWLAGRGLDSDGVLTSSFMITYVLVSACKSINMFLTQKSRGARILLGALGILVPVISGWLYLSILIWNHQSSRMENACIYIDAFCFGISYVTGGILKGKTEEIPFVFWIAMAFQVGGIVFVGCIGAFVSTATNASLIVGLICMESLPNIPGALDILLRCKEAPVGFARWLTFALGSSLLLGIAVCACAIYFQDYALLAGGITITILQSIPWAQVAWGACNKWAQRPARALILFVILWMAVAGLCIGLSVWIASGRGYTETDLVSVWYTLARLPSAVGLGFFGFLGVVLVGERAKGWKYLLIAINITIVVGFVWFVPALAFGGMDASIAPALLMQVAGGVNVTLVYAAANSESFQAEATMALASKPPSWGNRY